jgi:hypothetical protein
MNLKNYENRTLFADLLTAVMTVLLLFPSSAFAQTDSHQVEVSLEDYRVELPNLLPPGPTTFHIINRMDVPQNFALIGQGFEAILEEDLEPGEMTTLEVDLKEGIYLAYSPLLNYAALGMETTFFVTDERQNPATADEPVDSRDSITATATMTDTEAITDTSAMTGTGMMTGAVMRAKQNFETEEEFRQALNAAGYADEAEFREAVRQEATLDLVIVELSEEINVSEEEIRDFYQDHIELFRTEPAVILPLEQVRDRIERTMEMRKLEEIAGD